MPPVVRARAGSARQNRLNTSAASPGAQARRRGRGRRPRPPRRRPRPRTSIGRPSPCSIALATRLRRIRSIRRGRPRRRTAPPALDRRSVAALALGERLHRLDDPAARAPAGRSARPRGRRRPASYRLISSRSASSASNRSSWACRSSATALDRRVEVGARLVQHVGRHPHGGQRGAQLVRDVGDEPALHPGQVLELADLALQAGGHPVERRRQPGQVVLAAHPHPLLEPAGGEPLGDPRRHPHRRHDLAGDQPGDAADQEHQRRAPPSSNACARRGRGSSPPCQREQEVELVGAQLLRQRPPASPTTTTGTAPARRPA